MAKIRVLLADDHAILRTGLRMLINSQPDMEVIDEAADGREVVRKTLELHPDVVVMDISMPAGGGIKATETITQHGLKTRILMLTMHQDPAYVRTSLSAGAIGYIAKQAADTELISGIRAVNQGHIFIDPTLAGTVVHEILIHSTADGAPGSEPSHALSPREHQVLELLAHGYTNQQIADRLFLSVKTTETYRARLGRKLGLRDRADFIRYGLEMGFLSPNHPQENSESKISSEE